MNSNHLPPSSVIEQIWDFVDPFVCPITLIRHNDEREPPGNHHGTGWFIEKDGTPHLCTCEHVAKDQTKGQLGYACFGNDYGISVRNRFLLEPHPIDFAIASLELTWNMISHNGRCIPRSLLACTHKPVEDEYLYVQGFPGVDSRPAFGQHNVRGIGAFLNQVTPPSELSAETPKVDPDIHICMAWNPANATPLVQTTGALSAPSGLSGSVLWNTRYREVTESGQKWTTNDIRVTGIVWGASSKVGVVVGTPIECLAPFL